MHGFIYNFKININMDRIFTPLFLHISFVFSFVNHLYVELISYIKTIVISDIQNTSNSFHNNKYYK